MNNYCPYPLALKLKKAGYDELCDCSYGTQPTHKDGSPMSDETEFRLRSEGRIDEITYTPGTVVYDFYNTNSELDGEPVVADCEDCSRMLYTEAEDWLNKKHNITVSVEPYVTTEGFFYLYKVFQNVRCMPFNGKGVDMMVTKLAEKTGFESIENARYNGIHFALDNILDRKK